MDVRHLRSLMHSWASNGPKRLEHAAAYKDALALAKSAPTNPIALRFQGDECTQTLLKVSLDLKEFLLNEVVPCITNIRTHKPTDQVIAPLTGGVPVSSPQSAKTSGLIRHVSSHCCSATFNPGRSGFAALVTNELLHWRLEATAALLTEHGIDVCVTPGARFPPGAALPPTFPFVWIGTRTTSWAGVGCFIKVELMQAVEHLTDLGDDRILWLKIEGLEGTLILCAMYPAPGGDEATWDQIISEFHLVRSRFPSAKVYIMGDGNVHLSSAVQHEQPCKCLHCNQKANDRRIENKLKATGLVILDVGGPTHESGTVIDIGLSLPEHAVSATPLTAGIAASDHCPVLIRVPFIVSEDEHFIVGRVLWSDTE